VILKHLSIVNFRNYADAELEFCSGANCLVGDNGSGKTTVLDAIHYLSFCKSYFNPLDQQNIRYEEGFFLVQGSFEKQGELDKLSCGVKTGIKKQFKRNDKEYSRLADHIGKYPAVMLTPNDIDLIKEGSEVRRKFMDAIISQYNREYLDKLMAYNRAMVQRNNLLRYFAENNTYDEDMLLVWDEQLIQHGTFIHAERVKFVNDFIPGFNSLYHEIAPGAESVSLKYLSELDDNSFFRLLQASRSADRAARRTTQGIHKDDLDFLIDGNPIRRFGSQGQQKTYLIALKLAQFEFVERATGVKPVLLLDDIFDKIDDKRVAALMALVNQHRFGQIFITDTSEERIPKMFRDIGAELRIFHVDRGQVQSVDLAPLNHGTKE
jgi:DNA replication and repair protein RecF